MRKIDRSDIALLREVTSNARTSHVELAERVGLSSTACARRLAGLEQDGLIEGYQAVLGLKALGLGTTVMVRITLEVYDKDSKDIGKFKQTIIAPIRFPNNIDPAKRFGTNQATYNPATDPQVQQQQQGGPQNPQNPVTPGGH